MFDRFDDSSRKTMALSYWEACRLGHRWIDVEHISLALLQGGAVAWILSKLGASLSSLRDEIEDRLPERQAWFTALGQLPFTPRAKRALESAFAASNELRHRTVTPMHLFLGILSLETDSIAAQSLVALNITYDAVRRETILFHENSNLLREAQTFRPKLTRRQLFSEPAWRSLRALSVFCLFIGGLLSLSGQDMALLDIFGLPVTSRGVGELLMASALVLALLAFRSRPRRRIERATARPSPDG